MDKPKGFLDYYPNRTSNEYNYVSHSKDYAVYRERIKENYFSDKSASPVKYWFKDKENLGPVFDDSHLSSAARLNQEQRWGDFRLWLEWTKAGSNLFSFSKGLFDMLARTNTDSICLSEIELPFDAIYLDLSALGLSYLEGPSNQIEGVYISKGEPYMSEKDVEHIIWFDFVGNYIGDFIDIDLMLVQGTEFNSYCISSHNFDGNKVSIKESLAERLEPDGIEFVKGTLEDDKVKTINAFTSLVNRTAYLLVNCLLYLALPGREVQQQQLRPDVPQALQKRLAKANTKAKRKAVEADIRGLGFTRVNLVGSSIRPRAELAASTDTVAPHWRRGHWRNQRLGAGLQEQRLTWIKPVVVNKQLGQPAKGHIYNVQGKPANTTSPSPAAT